MRGQFELFYQLVGNQGQLYEATDILDTDVFRMLRVDFEVGIGSAAGLYQSLVGFCLIMFINWAIKRNHEEYALSTKEGRQDDQNHAHAQSQILVKDQGDPGPADL